MITKIFYSDPSDVDLEENPVPIKHILNAHY